MEFYCNTSSNKEIFYKVDTITHKNCAIQIKAKFSVSCVPENEASSTVYFHPW